MRASPPPMSMKSFSEQDFTAALVLQADPQIALQASPTWGWSKLSANFSHKPRSRKAHRFHRVAQFPDGIQSHQVAR